MIRQCKSGRFLEKHKVFCDKCAKENLRRFSREKSKEYTLNGSRKEYNKLRQQIYRNVDKFNIGDYV